MPSSDRVRMSRNWVSPRSANAWFRRDSRLQTLRYPPFAGEIASLNKRAPSRFAREDARSFLNSYSLLGAVRRPEAHAGDVRQNVVVGERHLRNSVN